MDLQARWVRGFLAAAPILLLGCHDDATVSEPEGAAPVAAQPSNNLAVTIDCVGDVTLPSLTCGRLNRVGSLLAPQFLIVGGQGQFVTLANTPPAVRGRRFQFDVTVQNLIPQPLGTPDGTTVTGVKVFFHTMPHATGGSGDLSIAVDNTDGTGTFTATNQPYYEYLQIIEEDEVSAPKQWQFTLGNGVTTFAFQVFVWAEVQWPNGFVQISSGPDAVSVGGTTMMTGSAVDAVGRPTGGTVSWTSGDEAIATVNSSSGEVTGVAGGVVDITASSDGPEAARSERVTVIDASGYDVELRYMTGATASQAAAFSSAVTRWEGHITNDLSDILLQVVAGDCDPALPAINEVVDDLLIFVFLEPIDGPLGILGQAGPCYIRTTGSLPVAGLMRFDTADLDGLETDGLLDAVILHEMAHVMGSGTVWEILGLLDWNGNMLLPCYFNQNNEPRFLGAQAVAAYNGLGGVGDTVPVEDEFGAGTQCSHWNEEDFDNELMTGFINPAAQGNPLSIVTVEAFEDLGYSVDPTGVDAYSLPGAPLAAVTQTRRLLGDVRRGPIYWVDERGRLSPARPGGR